MDVLHPRCCGLDVRSISACILLREAGRVQKHQRRFGAMTQELQELAEWLRQFGVTQVGPWWRTTPQNLFVELPEFLHFSVVQHFSTSMREHASQCLLQLLICVSV